jgi:hypothetical protein
MSLLNEPTIADSPSVLTSSPVVDPYSLSGASGTDLSQPSSGECYDSSCSVMTSCIAVEPIVATIDPAATVDPILITDPIPVDPIVIIDPTYITDPIAIDPIDVIDRNITDPIPVDPPISIGIDPFAGGLTSPDGIALDGWYQVLQDGTSLASGWSTDGTNSPVLVDYNADGSVNTDFGNNGELSGPAGATYLWANQTESGTIQIQGSVTNSDGSYNSFFEQFTASGQLDTSFGGGSGSLTAPDGVSFNGNFTMLSNGDILAGAASTDASNTPVVVDYTSFGVVNTAFGNNGEIIAPTGVTSEWFYQDGSTGDVVITDTTKGEDGTSILVSTSYSTDGQIDPSNPVVTYNVDPIPVDVPVVMYNMAGGMTDRTVTESLNPKGSSDEVPQVTQASSATTVGNTRAASNPDSFVIPGDSSIKAVSLTEVSASSPAVSIVAGAPTSDPSPSNSHVEDFHSSSASGIAGVSALKLAAAAASKGSSESSATDFLLSTDSLELPLPVSLKDGFSAPRKASKTNESDVVSEVSPVNESHSEEELISALLAEA